jgi:transposase
MLHCFFFRGGRMAEKDSIMLRQRELKRLHVLHKVLEGRLTQTEAAALVSLTDRQLRRIVKRIRKEGDKGICHKARGKPSNRRLPSKLKKRIVHLYHKTYTDFGPTLFTEKLEEREGITISHETARTWLMEEGAWELHRRHRAHRQWRERKDHYGAMLQMDGSHHDWFEGRGPACVFMGYIDDATGRVYGKFYGYEGTIPAMDSFKKYIGKYGLPMSVYLDKHTTYKSPAEPTLEDELNGTEPLSEFGRALAELGVELIHAHSPQAKGRIERLFNTLQDRLVKEMRLEGISTMEEANKFLVSYLPWYNRRFAVQPKKKENLHRRPKGLDLDTILCMKIERTLKNDNTIQHNRKLYQIEDRLRTKRVMVEDRIDGTMRIRYNGVCVSFHEIMQRPVREQKEPPFCSRSTAHTPSAGHPWRRRWNKRPITPEHCGNMEKVPPLPHSHSTATELP